MDELTKTELALGGVIKKIQQIFSLGEINDIKINELKKYIEYYEELRKQIETIQKERASEALDGNGVQFNFSILFTSSPITLYQREKIKSIDILKLC